MTSRFDCAAIRKDRRLELDHAAYPIEQCARSRRTRFQAGFARLTMRLLPRFKASVLRPMADGLRILAAEEAALAEPGAAIRRLHGDDVELGEPRARLLHGAIVQEPIMWLHATCERACTEDVIQDLVLRNAEIEAVHWLSPRPDVHARAPLRELIGYPRILADLTRGTAQVRMWLSHYAPVPPPSGSAA